MLPWESGMEESSDQELVARLRRGDAAAFDDVFDRYRARLYSFLVRLSGRPDVAEDLLQETWIRLATRVLSLREDAKFAPWLFTVARNLYCSQRRSTLLAVNRAGQLESGRNRYTGCGSGARERQEGRRSAGARQAPRG
jgi:RNA polymerase sigma factor (sigma-70 family)